MVVTLKWASLSPVSPKYPYQTLDSDVDIHSFRYSVLGFQFFLFFLLLLLLLSAAAFGGGNNRRCRSDIQCHNLWVYLFRAAKSYAKCCLLRSRSLSALPVSDPSPSPKPKHKPEAEAEPEPYANHWQTNESKRAHILWQYLPKLRLCSLAAVVVDRLMSSN